MPPTVTLISQQGINRISFGIRVTQSQGQKTQDFIFPNAYLEPDTKRLCIANDSEDIPSPDEHGADGDSERDTEPGIVWYAGDRSSRLTIPCTVVDKSGVVRITPNNKNPPYGPAIANPQFLLNNFTSLGRQTTSDVSLLTDSTGCLRVRVPLGWKAVFADAEGNTLCQSEIYLAVCTIDPFGGNIEWQMALELEQRFQSRDTKVTCGLLEVVYQRVTCTQTGFKCDSPLRWRLFHNRLEDFIAVIAVYHPLRPNDSYIEPIAPQGLQDSYSVSRIDPPLRSNFVMASGKRLSFGFAWPRSWSDRKHRLRFVRMTHNSNDDTPATPRDSHHWTITGDLRLAGTWTPGNQAQQNHDLSPTPQFMILGLAGSEVLDRLTPDPKTGPIFRFERGACLSVENKQTGSDTTKLVREYEYTPGSVDAGSDPQHLVNLKIWGETAWLRVFADTAYRMEPANECLYDTPEMTDGQDWRTGDPKRTQVAAWKHDDLSPPLFPIAPYLGLEPYLGLDRDASLPDALDFETAVLTPSRASAIVDALRNPTALSGEASSGLVFRDTSKGTNRVEICLGDPQFGAAITITCDADQAVAWNAAGKPTIVRIPAATFEDGRHITIHGSVGVGSWKLKIQAGSDTFLVFKQCDRTLRSWMETISMSRDEDDRIATTLLQKYSAVDQQSNPLNQRLDSSSWRGVIILNAGTITASEMPESIRWVLASAGGEGKKNITCPFIGFDVARSFPQNARSSSFFGRLAYIKESLSLREPLPMEVSRGETDPFLKYTLEKLILSFENTAVTSFSCEVKCSVGKFFGEMLSNDEGHTPTLTLSGRHSRATGADRYDFELASEDQLKDPLLVPRLDAKVKILSLGVVWGATPDAEPKDSTLTGTTSFGFSGNVVFDRFAIFDSPTTLPFTRWGVDVTVRDYQQKDANELPIVFDLAKGNNTFNFANDILPVSLDGVFLARGTPSWNTLGYVPIGDGEPPIAGFLASAPWPTRGKLAAKKNDSRVRVLVGWTGPENFQQRGDESSVLASIVIGIQLPDGPLDVGLQEIVRLKAESVRIIERNRNKKLLLSGAKLTVGRRTLLTGSAALLRSGSKWAFVGYGPNPPSAGGRYKPDEKYLVSVGAGWDGASNSPPTYPDFPPTPDSFDISDNPDRVLILVDYTIAGQSLLIRLCDSDGPLYYAEWSGLKLVYRRVSDSVSEFSFGFRPSQSIGPLSVTPPWITVTYASDATITLDVGFPYDSDFTRSAQFVSPPWYGACGILIRAKAGQVAGVIGIGVAIGYGFAYNAPGGILTVRGSIAVYGVVWGSVEIDGSRSTQDLSADGASLPSFKLTSLDGIVGLRGDLQATVNFQVVSAVVDLLFDARVPFNIENSKLFVGKCTVSVTAKATVTLFAYYDFKGKKHKEKVSYEYNGSFVIDKKGINSTSGASAEYAGVPSISFRQNFERVETSWSEDRLILDGVSPDDDIINVYVAPFVHAIADPGTLSGSDCKPMLTLCASVDSSVSHKMLKKILAVMNANDDKWSPLQWRNRLQMDVGHVRQQWRKPSDIRVGSSEVVKAVSDAVRIVKRGGNPPPANKEVRVPLPVCDGGLKWSVMWENGTNSEMPLNKSVTFTLTRFDSVDPYAPSGLALTHVMSPTESLVAESLEKKWAAFVTGFQCSCIEEALNELSAEGVYSREDIYNALNPENNALLDKVNAILKSTATKESSYPALPVTQDGSTSRVPWLSFAQLMGSTVDVPTNSGGFKVTVSQRQDQEVEYSVNVSESVALTLSDFKADSARAMGVIQWSPLSLWSHVAQEYNAHLLFSSEIDSKKDAFYAFGQDLVSRLRLDVPGVVPEVAFKSVGESSTLAPACVMDLEVFPANVGRSYVMTSVRAAEIPPQIEPTKVRVFVNKENSWVEVTSTIVSPIVWRHDLCQEEGPVPGIRGEPSAHRDPAGLPAAADLNDPVVFWQLCRESGLINGRGYCLDLGDGYEGVGAVRVVATLKSTHNIYANAVEVEEKKADPATFVSLGVFAQDTTATDVQRPLLLAHASRAPAGCLGVEVCLVKEEDMPLGYHMITLLPIMKSVDEKWEVVLTDWRTRPRQPIEVSDDLLAGLVGHRSDVGGPKGHVKRRYPIVVRHPRGWTQDNEKLVRSPYSTIGMKLEFAVVQEDFEGRLCDSGHGFPNRLSAFGHVDQDPPRVIYHDPLIPISEWPDVSIKAVIDLKSDCADNYIKVQVTITRKKSKALSDGEDLWEAICDQVNDERWTASIVGSSVKVVTDFLDDLKKLVKGEKDSVSGTVNVKVAPNEITPVDISLEVFRKKKDDETEADYIRLFPSEVPGPVARDEAEPCKRRVTRVAVGRPTEACSSGAFAVSRDRNCGAEQLWFVGSKVLEIEGSNPTLYGLRPVVKRPVTSSKGSDIDTGIMLQRAFSVIEQFMQGAQGDPKESWVENWRKLAHAKRKLAGSVASLAMPLFKQDDKVDGIKARAGQHDALLTVQQAALRDLAAAFETDVLGQWGVALPDGSDGSKYEFLLRCDLKKKAKPLGREPIAEKSVRCRVRPKATCVSVPLRAVDLPADSLAGESIQPSFHLDAILHPEHGCLTLLTSLRVEGGEAFNWAAPLRTIPSVPVIRKHAAVTRKCDVKDVGDLLQWYYDIVFDVDRDENGFTFRQDEVCVHLEVGSASAQRRVQDGDVEAVDRALADAAVECSGFGTVAENGIGELALRAEELANALGNVLEAVNKPQGNGGTTGMDLVGECVVSVISRDDGPKNPSLSAVVVVKDAQLTSSGATDQPQTLAIARVAPAGEVDWLGEWVVTKEGASFQTTSPMGSVDQTEPLGVRVVCVAGEIGNEATISGGDVSGLDVRLWTSAKVSVRVARNRELAGEEVNEAFVFEAASTVPSRVYPDIAHDFVRLPLTSGNRQVVPGLGNSCATDTMKTFLGHVLSQGVNNLVTIEVGVAPVWNEEPGEATEAIQKRLGAFPLLKSDGVLTENHLDEAVRRIGQDLTNLGSGPDVRLVMTMRIDAQAKSAEGDEMSYRQVARFRRVWCDPHEPDSAEEGYQDHSRVGELEE